MAANGESSGLAIKVALAMVTVSVGSVTIGPKLALFDKLNFMCQPAREVDQALVQQVKVERQEWEAIGREMDREAKR